MRNLSAPLRRDRRWDQRILRVRNPTNANTAAIIPTTKDSIEHSVELATPLVVWRTCACGQADLGQMTHIVFRRSAAAKGRGGLFQTKRN
jgi:hypothetical protein